MWDATKLADLVLSCLRNANDDNFVVLRLTYWQKMEISFIMGVSHWGKYFDIIYHAIEEDYDQFMVILDPSKVIDIYDIIMDYGRAHPDYISYGRWYYTNYYK